MKILHTSDIHLVEFEDERWKTLVKLLEIGKRENIDILVICGDLFDNETAAENFQKFVESRGGNVEIVSVVEYNSDSYEVEYSLQGQAGKILILLFQGYLDFVI